MTPLVCKRKTSRWVPLLGDGIWSYPTPRRESGTSRRSSLERKEKGPHGKALPWSQQGFWFDRISTCSLWNEEVSRAGAEVALTATKLSPLNVTDEACDILWSPDLFWAFHRLRKLALIYRLLTIIRAPILKPPQIRKWRMISMLWLICINVQFLFLKRRGMIVRSPIPKDRGSL